MAIVGTPITQKKFVSEMRKVNMHKNGNQISVKDVDIILGNVLPKKPSCKDCDAQKLERLTYICKYRDLGLLHGRYFGQNGNDFVTYDAVYNNDFVLNYANKAVNAATRGNALNNSTSLKNMKHKTVNDVHFKVAIKALKSVK